MKVILYNVGRNLNRAFRTCFSFGVDEMVLINSKDRSIEWELKGNLYSAKDRVRVTKLCEIPEIDIKSSVALENYYKESIYGFDFKNIDTILIGGETTGLPKEINCYKITIPTINNFCLTVEASLAIVLYEWRRHVN